MYLFLAFLSGVTLSVMISVNGNLAAYFGTFPAAAIIHLVGSLTALLLCAIQREKRKLFGHRPYWMYLGGAIGVLTTVFQNFAFGRISMTSIVALGLLGQTCMSFAVDRYGLLGMEKQSAQTKSWAGIPIALIGIVAMLDGTIASGIAAVCLSFLTGVTVVVSRTVNARLAAETGALRGSLVNHLVGLPITVALAALVGARTPFPRDVFAALPPWLYVGGVLGVVVVLLCNLTVPKISAFRMTLLGFAGQVFTGILLDVVFGGAYSQTSFVGGVIIAVGIAVNLISERVRAARERKRRAYFERIERVEAEHRASVLRKWREDTQKTEEAK